MAHLCVVPRFILSYILVRRLKKIQEKKKVIRAKAEAEKKARGEANGEGTGVAVKGKANRGTGGTVRGHCIE